MLRDNAGTLIEDGIFGDEDIRNFTGKDFFERCHAPLNTLMAMSALVELELKLEGAVNPAFMIAIAGGMNMIQ